MVNFKSSSSNQVFFEDPNFYGVYFVFFFYICHTLYSFSLNVSEDAWLSRFCLCVFEIDMQCNSIRFDMLYVSQYPLQLSPTTVLMNDNALFHGHQVSEHKIDFSDIAWNWFLLEQSMQNWECNQGLTKLKESLLHFSVRFLTGEQWYCHYDFLVVMAFAFLVTASWGLAIIKNFRLETEFLKMFYWLYHITEIYKIK